MCFSQKLKVSLNFDTFRHCLDILIEKPQVSNRRVWGNKILFKGVRYISSDWKTNWNCPSFDSMNDQNHNIPHIFDYLNLYNNYDTKTCMEEVEVILVELLPKDFQEPHAFQLIIIRKILLTAHFFDVTPINIRHKLCPDFNYILQVIDDEIKIIPDDKCQVFESKSYKWLTTTVLPQFVKWTEGLVKTNIYCPDSLTLVDNDQYYNKYNFLKLKYGKKMVEIWPECTDPSKFVYEDIAIASYLLLLWDEEKIKLNIKLPQTFVDLGCGNGLLVYILTSEGHPGLGIDIRKRKIWSIYPSETKLEEKVIEPSNANLFPEADWVIGNHSDELTPWIPIIASRSSYHCNFFLLPCCAHNFDGSKYQRQNSAKSLYNEYLEHIKALCEDCGFNTHVDRLKIPSTKRICIVGRGRTYPECKSNEFSSKIQNMLNIKNGLIGTKNETWLDNFKARDAVEKVKNCTQLDKNIIESIINIITEFLLEGVETHPYWFIGKCVDISDIVGILPPLILRDLKSECGGLQTLMRNNNQIFKVQKGKVSLQYPKTINEVSEKIKNKVKLQTKDCWFHKKHPQGCPLSKENCSFKH